MTGCARPFRCGLSHVLGYLSLVTSSYKYMTFSKSGAGWLVRR
jgi:hypothetical protein